MPFGVWGLVVTVYLGLLFLAALWAVVERMLSALESRRQSTRAAPTVEPEQDSRGVGLGSPLPH